MPLGQGISEMWDAVRDRVEVAGHGPTWEVTAGTFESALAYARERFGDPAVLDRSDRDRWWPRVTITVTTDPALAGSAPPLEEMALPRLPVQPTREDAADTSETSETSGSLPSSLEAIFAHQEAQRRARANSQ
jgi:hypothetical protein